MSKKKVILSIDQGTTGTRAILYDARARFVASAYQEFRQFYPKPGWVEHDPSEIWRTTRKVILESLRKARLSGKMIEAIGITNQRETVVLWDRQTGKPVLPAIVWQDRRTSDICARLKKRGLEKTIRHKTGLVIDPYFSGSKLTWIFDRYPRIKKRAQAGHVLFGTIDTWLLWKLTGGTAHATEVTNASRTLLYNIRRQEWDKDLLKIFKVPKAVLPEVHRSGACFGYTSASSGLPSGIPVHGILGDQQAALYGQGCYRAGQVKNTYGTGCFVVLNAGHKIPKVPHGLLVTMACNEAGNPTYALEGSIFIAGAAIQWLRDGLRFFKSASQTYEMVRKLKDSGGVTVIPAFAGLGSPHWNPDVRGVILGLTRGTTKEHIIRATLESIAHQSADVVEKMQIEAHRKIHELKVDGGATGNPFLMQTQADLLQIPILVSDISESTAWGVAKLAGKASGFWSNLTAVDAKRKYKRYVPKTKKAKIRVQRRAWKQEVLHLVQSKLSP